MMKGSKCLLLLAGFVCASFFDAAAATSDPPQSENVPVNAEFYARPDYLEAIAKDIEKQGADALKSQDDAGRLARNSLNEFDVAGYGHNKKFAGHRKPDIPSSSRRFTETIIYPSDLLNIGGIKRNFDEIDRTGFSGFNGKRNFDEIDRTGFSGFNGKRNFDEIDRSGFSGFNKRNFDEIDRAGFSGFNKRNFDEIDRTGFSGFNGKRNFDEIDRAGFSGFNKRNFDEIDRTGFAGFNRKRNFDEIDRSGFSGFNRKRNFDEIDRAGFSGFSKRNFDEIDRSGVPGFTKRSVRSVSRSNQRRR